MNHFASLSYYRSSKDYKIMLINNITQPSVGADLSRPPPIYRPSWRVSPYPDLKVTLHYQPSWMDIPISSFHSQCTSSASQVHFDCPKVHPSRRDGQGVALIPTYSFRSLARVYHQAFASTARKPALARTRLERRTPTCHPERSEGSRCPALDPSLRSG